jgi:hypothetical protein
MQVKTTATVQITLILSSEEAQWLHELMQNPLFGEHPGQEYQRNKAMRFAFFEATEPTTQEK